MNIYKIAHRMIPIREEDVNNTYEEYISYLRKTNWIPLASDKFSTDHAEYVRGTPEWSVTLTNAIIVNFYRFIINNREHNDSIDKTMTILKRFKGVLQYRYEEKSTIANGAAAMDLKNETFHVMFDINERNYNDETHIKLIIKHEIEHLCLRTFEGIYLGKTLKPPKKRPPLEQVYEGGMGRTDYISRPREIQAWSQTAADYAIGICFENIRGFKDKNKMRTFIANLIATYIKEKIFKKEPQSPEEVKLYRHYLSSAWRNASVLWNEKFKEWKLQNEEMPQWYLKNIEERKQKNKLPNLPKNESKTPPNVQ